MITEDKIIDALANVLAVAWELYVLAEDGDLGGAITQDQYNTLRDADAMLAALPKGEKGA